MERIFCASCGTVIQAPAPCCPCCGRKVNWEDGSQPELYRVRRPVQPAVDHPDQLFSEGQSGAANHPQSQQPAQPEYEPLEQPAPVSQPLYAGGPARPDPAQGQRLRFSEALVLALCGLVPLLGTVVLAIAAFTGGPDQENRRTMARAMLVVNLAVALLLLMVVAGISSLLYSLQWLYW